MSDSFSEVMTHWSNDDLPEYLGKVAIRAFISEVKKGCTGEIHNEPLKSIQPQYDFFSGINSLGKCELEIDDPDYAKSDDKLRFVIIKFHEDDGGYWYDAPFGILSQLSSVLTPITFECLATNKTIQIQFCVNEKYVKIIGSSLNSFLPNSKINISKVDLLKNELKDKKKILPFIDSYYPNYPYHRNLIVSEQKDISHIFKLLKSLSLSKNELFYYRVLFERTTNKWDRNCFNLYTYEKKVLNIYPELNLSNEYFIPPATESKAYNQKKINPEHMPMFFVQPMICFWGSINKYNAIKTFINCYIYGDSLYKSISEDDFVNEISIKDIYEFLLNRKSHIQGHLLNREELAHFLALPCEQCIETDSIKLQRSDNIQISDSLLDFDIKLGEVKDNDRIVDIGISIDDFEYSTFILGKQGTGKSTLLLNILEQLGQL